eukprot:TRINITY_DN7875_c0_g1_i1.p1 TRINITY_DN7875_c0_g1~~TRINITY_DN7875_c0_g1_i1.p1  ORF type:complete len:226 (-),score=66.83 TRINITY_DN7875_c0_g1_i1:93-770(-)
MAKRAVVELFYDVVSPYSWLGFEIACRYAAAHPDRFVLRLRPFFLGGVMHGTGNQPPAFLPARGLYMPKDVARSFEWAGLSGQVPSRFPLSTLKAMRLLTAVSDLEGGKHVEGVSRQLWHAYWGRDEDITDDTVLERCVRDGSSGALEGARILSRCAEAGVKEALKAATQDAIDRGAYGAPTFFVHADGEGQDGGEMFFGSDRFHLWLPLVGVQWVGPHPLRGRL